MQSNKLDTKNVSLIAADKNIWLAGMILAVVLIVIQSLSLFPRNISDDSPFLLRDLNHIAKAIHNSTQVYRLKEIVYIFILVIFSRYLRYFEMHGVRKAIYIIISTTALTLLSSYTESMQEHLIRRCFGKTLPIIILIMLLDIYVPLWI